MELDPVLGLHAGDAAGRGEDRLGDGDALDDRGSSLPGVLGQDLVEVGAGTYEAVVREVVELGPRHLEGLDATAVDAEPLVAQPTGLGGRVDAQLDELATGARCQAVAADLLAREVGLLQHQDVEPGAGQVRGGRGATRTGAHDDDVGRAGCV